MSNRRRCSGRFSRRDVSSSSRQEDWVDLKRAVGPEDAVKEVARYIDDRKAQAPTKHAAQKLGIPIDEDLPLMSDALSATSNVEEFADAFVDYLDEDELGIAARWGAKQLGVFLRRSSKHSRRHRRAGPGVGMLNQGDKIKILPGSNHDGKLERNLGEGPWMAEVLEASHVGVRVLLDGLPRRSTLQGLIFHENNVEKVGGGRTLSRRDLCASCRRDDERRGKRSASLSFDSSTSLSEVDTAWGDSLEKEMLDELEKATGRSFSPDGVPDERYFMHYGDDQSEYMEILFEPGGFRPGSKHYVRINPGGGSTEELKFHTSDPIERIVRKTAAAAQSFF